MKVKIISIVSVLVIALTSCNQGLNLNGKVESDQDSLSYALGVSIGSNLSGQFDTLNASIIAKAINDVYKGGDLIMDQNQANQFLRSYMQKEQARKSSANVKKGQAFLEENINKEGVQEMENGLQYKIIEEGSGASPDANDKVKVHYKGTLVGGEVFDSSYDRGKPAEFTVNRVIKGWSEALQHMKEGAKWELYIPPELAYGKKGAGQKIGPNETLIFEVELLEVSPQEGSEN